MGQFLTFTQSKASSIFKKSMLCIKSIILPFPAGSLVICFFFHSPLLLSLLLLTLPRLVLFSSLSPFLLSSHLVLLPCAPILGRSRQIVSCTGPDNHTPVILSTAFFSLSLLSPLCIDVEKCFAFTEGQCSIP